jgi:Mitochondrial carrier protein
MLTLPPNPLPSLSPSSPFPQEIVKERIGNFNTQHGIAGASSEAIRSFFGGGCASFFSQLVMVPADVVSSRLIVQGLPGISYSYKNGWDGFRQIARTEGIRNGIYRGFFASLMTYIPHSATWWGAYSASKILIYRATGVHESPSDILRPRDFVMQAAAGGVAAIAGCLVSNPMDVIKTRMQTKAGSSAASAGGIVTNFKTLLRNEGARALYTGLSMR